MTPAEYEDLRVCQILRGELKPEPENPRPAPVLGDLFLDRALGLPPSPAFRLAFKLARKAEDARVLQLLRGP